MCACRSITAQTIARPTPLAGARRRPHHRAAEWRRPLQHAAWGHDLWTVPPPSQGYLTLAGAFVAEAAGLAPEVLSVSGRDVYLHIPSGYHQAKLTNTFLERRLGRVATARNWRTVLALADLAGLAT